MPHTNADIAKLVADVFPEVFETYPPDEPMAKKLIFDDIDIERTENFTIRIYGELDGKKLVEFITKLEFIADCTANVSITGCYENTDFVRINFDLIR